MLKISRKASTLISLILTVILFAVIAAGVFAMPWLADLFLRARAGIAGGGEISSGERILLLAAAYIALVAAGAADCALFCLLRRIRAGEVFSDAVVVLLRTISWCCFIFAAFFAVLVVWFRLAVLVSFCAVFVGLCVRVVKNAFEEAVALKNENDFTI